MELSSSVIVAVGRSGFCLVMIGPNFFAATKSSFARSRLGDFGPLDLRAEPNVEIPSIDGRTRAY